MIELFGIKVSIEALVFVVLFVVDEVLALSPAKSNSIVQLLQNILRTIKPARREDEKVEVIKSKLLAIYDEVKDLQEK
jgi:hypothetical protein